MERDATHYYIGQSTRMPDINTEIFIFKIQIKTTFILIVYITVNYVTTPPTLRQVPQIHNDYYVYFTSNRK